MFGLIHHSIMGEVEHEVSCVPMRIFLTAEEIVSLDKEQILQQWSKQEIYINWMESQLSTTQAIGIYNTNLFYLT